MPDLDSWRPNACLDTLNLRAQCLAKIRRFFHDRSVLEVETPLLCRAVDPDPQIECFQSQYIGPQHPWGLDLFLHSSPEFHMKRLLSAGSGSIYQLGKVFRQGELGTLHHPEFTLLEWYRLDFDQLDLINEINQLLDALGISRLGLGPVEVVSYAVAFQRLLQIDPLSCSHTQLLNCIHDHGIDIQGYAKGGENATAMGRDFYLDCLMSHVIQPQLGMHGPLYLTDYPATQAALSQINTLDNRVARRFELFIMGVEIANGFCELTDADELEQRLKKDIAIRLKNNQSSVPMDQKLIAAQRHGLPPCAGVALGFDRLIMLLSGKKNIAEVLAFADF